MEKKMSTISIANVACQLWLWAIFFNASCCLWTVLEGGLKMNHVLHGHLVECACVHVCVGMVTQSPLKACRHAEFVVVLLLLIIIIIKSPDIGTYQN